MNRPTMPGVNTVAIDRFAPNGPGGYTAVYSDGTTGPTRSTRERAEIDYRDADAASTDRRAAIEQYGLSSHVFKPWKEIHQDFRSDFEGRSHALALDSLTGATVLARWLGPEA